MNSFSGTSGSGNEFNAIKVRGGNVTTSQTWEKQIDGLLPYIVNGDITVYSSTRSPYSDTAPNQVTLTLEPGVEVRFDQGTGLYIGKASSLDAYGYHGALNAQGTLDDPIVFTSNADTTTPGDWKGIYFHNATFDAGTLMEHCTVEYGGNTNNANIYITNAKPVIRSSTIQDGSGYGIQLSTSAFPTIEQCNIKENAEGGLYLDDTSRGEINGNVIDDNGGYAADVYPNWVNSFSGTSGSGNEFNAIKVRGGNVTTSQTWEKQIDGLLPYIVNGDITVFNTSYSAYSNTAPNQVTLTLAPGVEVRFEQGAGLYVGKSSSLNAYGYHGALSAQATVDDPIILTSNADTPAPGDWKGIYFHNATYDTGTLMEHCTVEYGGHTNDADISIHDSSPTIHLCTIHNSSGDGIYLDGDTNAEITQNTFSANTVSAINVHAYRAHLLVDNIGSGDGENLILVRGGNITASRTWKKQRDGSLPYVATGDISVYHESYSPYSDTAPSQVTLTLEPGVEVRFEQGFGLYIGKSSHLSAFGYHGALNAQATSDDPIIFTSATDTPTPGDWKGIYFHNATYDAGTLMEHCIVEYGGDTNNADIYITNAQPTLQYNTIRNSSHSGIYATGNASDAAPIRCNNLKDNRYGIYTAEDAQPTITGNNFLNNQTAGLYNAHPQTVTAIDNWWNDANGPNTNGDGTFGPVDVDSWLLAESDCVATPPTNSAPRVPGNPSPANGAVNVAILDEGSPAPVTLAWSGGDPNPWDTVVYDLYAGPSADALSLVSSDIGTTAYDLSGLAGGATYYWQIVARDDTGAETTGPVWHFTTLGESPDLEISQVSYEPTADIVAGQSVNLSATILNSGSGPVVDTFRVIFAIDGATVESNTVSPVIAAGASQTVSVAWIAIKGNHTLTVTADSLDTVDESHEENNTLTASLPEVTDTTPPTLSAQSPAGGAMLQALESISMTLADAHGAIDDAAVIASVVLIDGDGQTVAGSTTEANDVFTFIPAGLPLADGTYTFSLVATDDSGNTAPFGITFTIDGQAPAAPTLTGGEILSGTLMVQPAANQANTATITVTGTREDDTAVYIDGSRKVTLGSGDWSTTVSLSQGDNTLEIWLRDASNNASPSVSADVAVDSVAPAITATVPTADSFLAAAPAVVTVAYTETGSGLNIDNCTRRLEDADGNPVAGTWDFSVDGTIAFAPSAALTDDVYTLIIQLEDAFTNRGGAVNRQFTVDTVAPDAPIVDAVVSPTHNAAQTITGTKEEYAAIVMNGSEVVGHAADTGWQTAVALTSGENTFAFVARDRAGNTSAATTVTVVYDDIAPDPVETLEVDGQGSGTAAELSWTYDESAHGDIAGYRIYWQEEATFTDVSAMEPADTVPAGTFTATVTGLPRNATVWFAVVAVDATDNLNPAVTPVEALLEDIEAPGEVTGLSVASHADSLTFTWNAPADTDLAGYRIYMDGAADYTELTADQLAHSLTGLAAAEAHTLMITTVDDNATPNESNGGSITGVTWLPNPTGLAGEAFSGYVRLSWNPAQPSGYVRHYRVYTSDSAFGSIDTATGSHAVITATGTTAQVAGLTDGQTYWFAVTTVNTSGGENPVVTAVNASPEADGTGPAIADLVISGAAFADGYTLTAAQTLTITASDPSGVSRIVFTLDGDPLRTDYSAPYTCYLDPADMADGSHTLVITAFDTLDNSATLTIGFNVALALPAAPTITSPADGTTTNNENIVVSGEAEAGTSVKLYINDIFAGVSGAADGKGHFSIVLPLSEGENRVKASASNRSGEGPLSDAVTVTLDTSLPDPPGAVTATAKADGVIRIAWQRPSTGSVSGYHLYRSATEFTEVGQAQRVDADSIGTDRYEDVPATDGTWYYRVTSLDGAGNESEPSSLVSATADRVPPRVTAIVYDPQGAHDAGTMAPGTVHLEMTLSEALQAAPFFTITPAGGTPMTVDLVKVDETTYSGTFVIKETTPCGSAYAVFSGRDAVGNRGTEIDAGATIAIDTDGPSVIRLVVTPESPIQNDVEDPVTVTAVLGLNEAVKAGTLPTVGYLLSGEGRDVTEVDSLTELATANGDAQTFRAVFTLPADAGAADAESLSLTFSGVDYLDNPGSDIEADNRFQVYQGDLPPLAAPDGLTGTPLPGGRVLLMWNPVDEAVAYQIYRQGPGDTELLARVRLDDSALIEYTDVTDVDGEYTYAIASIRSENGQEAESGLSETVIVTADATAPGAPTDFALDLVANGIKATWTAPAYTEPITYSLYRAPQTEITSVDGLDALATGIKQTLVVDPDPSEADHCYTVTAVDTAGNQSTAATSAYLNFDLLPVSSIEVIQSESDAPVLSWTHTGSTIAGYDVFLGDEADGVPLNDTLITGQSYTDIGWSEDLRQYTVVAVDGDGVRSLGRTITLPDVHATLADDAVVRRGLMNRLVYTVENRSDVAVSNAWLEVELGGITHTSAQFSLAADEETTVDVVVGGYEELTDPAELTTTIAISEATNERVGIIRDGEVRVADGMLVLQILNDEFTRGASGTVWFTIENTGDEEIEIVTARSSGAKASDQVAFALVDADGNVIATQSFQQAVGDAVYTLSDKRSVARIGAGETFTAGTTTIDVPANAPDDVTLRLTIDKVHYHLGRDTQVTMDGLSTTHDITLAETSYTGQLDAIEPETSSGDEDVVITGRAILRDSGDPINGVPLRLTITHNGFERNFEVYTDSDGEFSYAYTPVSGESGRFQVRAVHPDLTDKPVHGDFVISRVSVSPGAINMNIPRNYEQQVSIKVSTGDGTDVTDLQLVYDPDDQYGGVLPDGIHITPDAAIPALNGGKSTTLNFTIWADNSALDTESIRLRLASIENDVWGTVTINAAFSDAAPVLYFTPDHVETGMAREETVTETVTLSNKGLTSLTGMTLTLLSGDGSPAPDWAALNVDGDADDLAVDDTREVSITFAPEAGTAEGNHHFLLRVTSDNYPQTDINLYAAVTQSGIGNVLFKVSDIYTGTLNDSLEVVQGLAGAKVVLQNEVVTTETHSTTTDAIGEAEFSDLTAGRYKARITADNHQPLIARVWVKPGITTTEDVFLDYNLVTVEWSVTETTIQDKYEIVLTAAYETDVPAAVVVIEPGVINLPDMQAGDVFNGEFKLTNHGLIRADDLQVVAPSSTENYTVELKGEIPTSIGAKQSVSIPYRIVCLSADSPSEGNDTGGGWLKDIFCFLFSWIYNATNGCSCQGLKEICSHPEIRVLSAGMCKSIFFRRPAYFLSRGSYRECLHLAG